MANPDDGETWRMERRRRQAVLVVSGVAIVGGVVLATLAFWSLQSRSPGTSATPEPRRDHEDPPTLRPERTVRRVAPQNANDPMRLRQRIPDSPPPPAPASDSDLPEQDDPWSSFPAHLKNPEFSEIVSEVQEECAGPGILVGADCSRPPCFAVFWMSREPVRQNVDDWLFEQLSDCPQWRDRFGVTVDRWTRHSRGGIDCDGEEHMFLILTPEESLSHYGNSQMQRKRADERRVDELLETTACP